MPANQLHPIYHVHTSQAGSRIDVDRILPVSLDDIDTDELIDKLSEPVKYKERISPVSAIIGTEVVRGKNWTEMMIKSYRIFFRMFSNMSLYMKEAMLEKFNERASVPYTGFDIDPDTLHALIEADYEQGENAYGNLLELYKTGVLSPTATSPFTAILPLLDNDFDRRICLRIGLLTYWDDIMQYHQYLEQNGASPQFVLPYWFPECGFSTKILEILHEEFIIQARKYQIRNPHLLIMLDTSQVEPTDIDILMKSWNVVKVGDEDYASVVFRDKTFSEWVSFSNPSVKKLIDRTIAKVDSGLNEKNVDYCWAHFEELDNLTYNNKASVNYDQKITKLTQLSYHCLSPDMFVRRKMDATYGKAIHEPQEVLLKDNTCWSDWHTTPSLGRWVGLLNSGATFKLIDENHPFSRRTKNGKVQDAGSQAWKYALVQTRDTVAKFVKGDPDTLKGGFLEILADLLGDEKTETKRRHIADFLSYWSHAHWREVFLQKDLSEADVEVRTLVDQYLLHTDESSLTDEEYIIAAVAAQGYYFILDSYRSFATAYENFDNRCGYQVSVMMTLSLCNLIALYRWTDNPEKEKETFDLLQNELLDFQSAFERYGLRDLGVTPPEWQDVLESHVEDSELNVIERAARRLAARHLRPLGYKKQFSREDEFITTNVGHVWSMEIENNSYKWENKVFCGLREE